MVKVVHINVPLNEIILFFNLIRTMNNKSYAEYMSAIKDGILSGKNVDLTLDVLLKDANLSPEEKAKIITDYKGMKSVDSSEFQKILTEVEGLKKAVANLQESTAARRKLYSRIEDLISKITGGESKK